MQTNEVTKVVQTFEQQLAKTGKWTGDANIKTDEDYASAIDEGKLIKSLGDTADEREKEITAPLNEALKSARDLFRPFKTKCANAVAEIKSKLLAYTSAKTKKAEDEKRKLAERVERGTMKPETAIRKIGEVAELPKTIRTEDAKATTKKITKYRVTDKSKVPLDFMEVDMVAVRKAYAQGNPVPGTESYEEDIVSFS